MLPIKEKNMLSEHLIGQIHTLAHHAPPPCMAKQKMLSRSKTLVNIYRAEIPPELVTPLCEALLGVLESPPDSWTQLEGYETCASLAFKLAEQPLPESAAWVLAQSLYILQQHTKLDHQCQNALKILPQPNMIKPSSLVFKTNAHVCGKPTDSESSHQFFKTLFAPD
jgi:hypothetical protein